MNGVLSDRAVISASGPDGKTFLQGLITNDTRKLAPEVPLYAALLTPQGKILFDFLLSESSETVFLDCAAASAAGLLKRLTLYRLRARVELALREDLAVIWSDQQGSADPRVFELGRRTVASRKGGDMAADYRARRLALGVPEGADFGSDKMFALDGGLEELHGVSFDKGCYIGQELTARMKHRGTARKRLLPLALDGGGDLPAPGTEIKANGMTVGEITAAYGPQGFALVRLDRLEELGGETLQAEAHKVSLSKPKWLTTSGETALHA